MYWTVDLSARMLTMAITLEEATERVLSALLERTGALGPITFANITDSSVGARFDLEAPDFETAIASGLAMFTEALASANVGTAHIIHGEASETTRSPTTCWKPLQSRSDRT